MAVNLTSQVRNIADLTNAVAAATFQEYTVDVKVYILS